MTKIAMSAAASGLLRALVGRAGVERDRILLTKIQSTDWQSLTFAGERHEIGFRIRGSGADAIATRLTQEVEHAEFAIPGHIVADVLVTSPARDDGDGSISVELEALTIAE